MLTNKYVFVNIIQYASKRGVQIPKRSNKKLMKKVKKVVDKEL